MGMRDWIADMAGKLLPGRSERKAVSDAEGLWNLRNLAIAIVAVALIVALIIFLPKIIIDSIVENNKELFCDHSSLDYSIKKYDYEAMTVRYGCHGCDSNFYAPMTCTENVIREASCTESGQIEKIYTVEGHAQLNKTVKVTVDQLPHTYEVLEKGFAPTCEEKGLTDYRRCKVCNWHFEAEEIAATGHTSVTLIPYKAPTCCEDGNRAKTQCSVCKKILAENLRIPTIDHSYEIHSTVAPTDYEPGYDLHKCAWCDKAYQDNYVSPLKQTLTFTDHYTYSKLIKVKTDSKVLVIPEYNGILPVQAITMDAVTNMECIEEIIIPKTITEIPRGAFKNLPNLKKIHFPEGLKKIETDAFMGCPAIEELEFPSTLEYLEARPFPDSNKILSVSFSEKSDPYVASYRLSNATLTLKLPSDPNIGDLSADLKHLPYLTELYMVEGTKLNSNIAAGFIVKHDYSEESSIIWDGDNCYAEIGGEYYFVATFTQEKTLSLPETVNGRRFKLRKNSLSLVIKSIDSISAYCTLEIARAAIGEDNKHYIDKISRLSYPEEE